VPAERQVALFSATLAPQIRRIAQRHLRNPREITIRSKTSTATNIRQRYWVVSGMHKLDALTRILEVEPFDAMLVFARTKQATVELAEKLEARGFAAAPLNGDILQAQRERTVAALKAGHIDILVATDVAARGLDVERIGHVINFDVPYDSESYVHRIGRTGRAGRSGEAILFIAPRERNMLRIIERATRQPIEPMSLPTVEDVNLRRVAKFKERLAAALATPGHEAFRPVIEEFLRETDADITDVAAALASLAQGDGSLLLGARADEAREAAPVERPSRSTERERPARSAARPARASERSGTAVDSGPRRPRGRDRGHEEPQATYRLEVGKKHGVQPGNIVGAIAHTADLDGSQINGVKVMDDHTLVRLPASLSMQMLSKLRRVRVRGRVLDISRVEGGRDRD
jgi:ATP-dependent RNA helicase DeaD